MLQRFVTRCLALVTMSLIAGCGPEGARGPEVGVNEQAIINGNGTTINDNPWQAQVYLSSGKFCGGTVLNANWILTAQHCLDNDTVSHVVVGSTKNTAWGSRLDPTHQLRDVYQVVKHPGYATPTSGNDVALLNVSGSLNLSSEGVKAIDIVTRADELAGDTRPDVVARVTGWGRLSNGVSPEILQTANVRIMSNSDAQQYYGHITADQLAATAGSCRGDSGGPLTVAKGSTRVLAGVVSWGSISCDPAYPGMYARVASFEDWITRTISQPYESSIPDFQLPPYVNTSASPAIVSLGRHTYAFYKGAHDDAGIYMLRTSGPFENQQWQAFGRLPGAVNTSDAPAAVTRGDYIYVVYKGAHDDAHIYVVRSKDGATWEMTRFPDTVNTSARPHPYVWGGSLYVTYKGAYTDARMYYARLPDEAVWQPASSYNGGSAPWAIPAEIEDANTSASPAVVAADTMLVGTHLYAFYKGAGADPGIYMLSLTAWLPPLRLPGAVNTSAAPAAVVRNKDIYVVYKGAHDDAHIYVVRRRYGASSWEMTRFPDSINTSTRPEAYVSGDALYVLYKGAHTDARMYMARLPATQSWLTIN